MTDISKEAVEKLAEDMDKQVMMLCGASSKEAQTLRAQAARIEELKEKLSYVENRNVLLSDDVELYKQGAAGAYLAGHDAGKAQCVSVKPLEFEEVHTAIWSSGKTIGGTYRIVCTSTGWRVKRGELVIGDGQKVYPTVAAAIVVAQADYARRIRSAITTQSADDVHNAAIEDAAVAVKEAFHMKGIIQKSQSAIRALKRKKGSSDALE